MNANKLRTHKSKDLAQMARRAGITGWHSMRKEELIKALTTKQPASPSASPKGSNKSQQGPKPQLTAKQRKTQKRIAELHLRQQRMQDLSTAASKSTPSMAGESEDQLVLLVRDPYWMQACWEISKRSVERAKTALAQRWHEAIPTLRLHKLDEEGAVVATRLIRIHGGVSHWFIDVKDPPNSYRAEIGYATSDGGFYGLTRSSEISMPESPLVESGADSNWHDVAQQADRIYAMSGGYSTKGVSRELQELLERRLKRPMGRPSETRYGFGPATEEAKLDLQFEVELVVRGKTSPHTHLTIQGEPIELEPTGAFIAKLPFPDRRQVIPIVASTADGASERKVVLGVERNTKLLEHASRQSPARNS